MITAKALPRAACALIAGALITVFTVTAAHAGTATSSAQAATAKRVSAMLGAETGGYYLDQQGHPVVNVLTDRDAATVTAAGVQARRVSHSAAELTSIKESLDSYAGITNTAWGIDPSTDSVVVRISDAADPDAAADLTEAAYQYGDAVRIEHITGTLEAFIRGGDAIRNSSVRCSDGFNVTRDGQLFVLTAGHCTNTGGPWEGLGNVVESDCPGADSGLIENNSGDGPSEINTGQPITAVGSATVGEPMEKSGSTTGYTTGQITSVDETVNFDVGVLYHMTGTTVHSDHGDSGGSGYDGSTGLGTLSGGNATTTYFYPLELEMAAYNLTLAGS